MNPKPITMPIYMDHNATTPLDPEVKAAMEPYLMAQFGNASSASHAFGWQAQSAVRKAREQVAAHLGCEPGQVIWTSGATESNNLAILGLVRAFRGERPHIITQATEHKAVLEVFEAATEFGAEITVLGVDRDGLIRMDELERAITPRTVLISIMMANNEIGTLQPIQEIAELCRERKIVFHSDAAQGVGKCGVDMGSLPIDMLSISGHKIYAPKGVGALIVRPRNRDFELKPLLFGGDQEKGIRPGTLNVPGIVALGAACEVTRKTMGEECARVGKFQDQILDEVLTAFPSVKLNGPRKHRLCNNISFSFSDICVDDMMLALSGIAYSSGSACNSGKANVSHVLRAIGVSETIAPATLRLGLGRFTTPAEVRTVTDKVLKMLAKATPKAAHA